MTLAEHIEELRKRLIFSLIGVAITTGFSFFFAAKLIAYLRAPYDHAMRQLKLEPHLQVFAPAEGFMLYMKIATWAGLVMASPWIFYQLWKFVGAGLYWKEKRYVYIAVPISAILFLLGTSFAIIYIVPYTISFLILFNRDVLGSDSPFRFSDYISFMVNTIVLFGICFQTPIVMFFLNKLGLASLSFLAKSRRYIIFVIVVLSAFLSPSADLISLFAMAVPLYLLYEMGIIVIRFWGRKELPES